MAQKLLVVLLILYFAFPAKVAANPYFYITGQKNVWKGPSFQYSLYLNTDNSTLTAAQTVVSFNGSILAPVSHGVLGSRCSFWSPADPSLNYGSTSTPYFKDANKFVVACGFSEQGYKTNSGLPGDLIATFSVTPLTSFTGTSNSNFSFSNSQFRYIGNTIIPGAMENFNLTVYDSTVSASTPPTPTPTPTLVPDTLTADQLRFIEIGSGTGQTPGDGTGQTGIDPQTGQPFDNTIPPAPDLTPRPALTPLPELGGSTDEGEVLSGFSLRELFVPGAASNQWVALINLVITFTFLVIVAILVWRLYTMKRLNAIKYAHMKDMVTGELAVLETKVLGDNKLEAGELKQTLDDLRKELESS